MSRGDQHATGEKGRRRRAEIIDAAERLFSEQGYERTTAQDIADATEILKGSLYYYIGSKEQLLFEVLLRTHQQLHSFVVEEVDYSALAAQEAVRTFVERHIEWVLGNSSVTGLYGQEFDVVRSVDAWWHALVEARNRYELALVGLVRRVDGAGRDDLTDEDDSVLTARAFLAMANGTRQWFRSNGSFTARGVATHHAWLAVRSLPEATENHGAG